jgi:hypothetical protein
VAVLALTGLACARHVGRFSHGHSMRVQLLVGGSHQHQLRRILKFRRLHAIGGVGSCASDLEEILMRMLLISVLVIAAVWQFGPGQRHPANNSSEGDFVKLMTAVSDGWNEGNARESAECFTDDAIYMEPPDRQVYIGGKAIYEFFGGPNKPEPPMHMTWHHLAWNESESVGYGEYTFQMNRRYHGIVTVQIRNGKIAKWREYQYQSASDWDAFAGKSRF